MKLPSKLLFLASAFAALALSAPAQAPADSAPGGTPIFVSTADWSDHAQLVAQINQYIASSDQAIAALTSEANTFSADDQLLLAQAAQVVQNRLGPLQTSLKSLDGATSDSWKTAVRLQLTNAFEDYVGAVQFALSIRNGSYAAKK